MTAEIALEPNATLGNIISQLTTLQEEVFAPENASLKVINGEVPPGEYPTLTQVIQVKWDLE